MNVEFSHIARPLLLAILGIVIAQNDVDAQYYRCVPTVTADPYCCQSSCQRPRLFARLRQCLQQRRRSRCCDPCHATRYGCHSAPVSYGAPNVIPTDECGCGQLNYPTYAGEIVSDSVMVDEAVISDEATHVDPPVPSDASGNENESGVQDGVVPVHGANVLDDASQTGQQAKAEKKAEAKSMAKAKAEAKKQADTEAKAKKKAEAKAKMEANKQAVAELKAEAEAKRKAENDAQAEAQAKKKAERRAKKKAEEKAKADADAKKKAKEKRKADENAKVEDEIKLEAASSEEIE